MWRASGRTIGVPSTVWVRFAARRKAGAPMAIAAAITKASDGSHFPARSRKPSTFAGLTMPDTMRPTPNTSPARNDVNVYTRVPLESEEVARNEDRHETRRHERQRGDERAR